MADVEMRCEAFVHTQRFLRAAGQIEWPDRSVARRYAFVHELYRQTVYGRITEGQCLRLHQRIGAALESAYGARQMEIAPQLAAHFERSHDDERALRYLRAAAARAHLRFANREAMGYLNAALALLEQRREDDARRRQELELRLALGAVLFDLCGYASEPVRENYERAAEVCRSVGRAAQRFEVSYALWYLQAARGERDAAIASTTRLQRLARHLGHPQRTVAVSVGVLTAAYDARFSEAERLMRRLASRHPTTRIAAPALGPEPILEAAATAALALWFLGYPERAQAAMREAVERARALGHFFTLAGILQKAALLEFLFRNAVTARELADEAVSLSAEHGFAIWSTVAGLVRGAALVQDGHASEGIAAILAELTAMQRMHLRYLAAFAYAFLSDGHLRSGALADGLAAVDAGLAVAASSLDRAYTPELWRLKGELLLKQLEHRQSSRSAKAGHRPTASARGTASSAAEAERCFERALEVARAAKAKSLELRAATSLARAWRARGRTTDARRLLAGVCTWFGTRANSADLVEARAFLDELAARPQAQRVMS